MKLSALLIAAALTVVSLPSQAQICTTTRCLDSLIQDARDDVDDAKRNDNLKTAALVVGVVGLIAYLANQNAAKKRERMGFSQSLDLKPADDLSRIAAVQYGLKYKFK